MFEITPETPPVFSPPKLEPWQQLLLDAAQRVRQGWCQFAVSDGHGNVCLLGALLEVGTGTAVPSGDWSPVMMSAHEAVSKYIGTSIPIFNNAWSRTAEDVASAMEAAAMEKVRV